MAPTSFADLRTGQRIAFDRYGSRTAPALVLLHGLSGDRGNYAEVIDALGERIRSGALQVVAVDLRGHGESAWADPQRYDAASYAQDIVALVDELGLGPVQLAGHSLGGVVAATVATARPDLVAALFLEDPPFFEGDEVRRSSSGVAAFFPMFVGAIRALQARDAPALEYEPVIAPMTLPDRLVRRASVMRHWDPATMDAAVSGLIWRFFDPLAVLPCRTTILRADPAAGAVFLPEDEVAFLQANPTAAVHLVPGATHTIAGGPTLGAYLGHLDQFLATRAIR